MKKISIATLIVGSILLMTIAGSAMGNYEEVSRDMLAQGTLNQVGILPRQANVTEPQPVHLFFNGGDGGVIEADVPQGNATTEVDCPGYPLPRAAGYYIGIWTSAPISSPITVEATVLCSLWVYSNEGANNVRFNVEIRVNNNEVLGFQTESKSVSSTPVEIKGKGSNSGSLELQPGDTFGVRLAYFSDSRYGIGPGAGSTLLIGSGENPSLIGISANSITVSVNKPLIDNDFVTFSATYTDAFASSTLTARLIVDGPEDVISLSDPKFSPGENGSTVSWNWNYKHDKGGNGEYIIIISLSYCEENNFIATETFNLQFPRSSEDAGLLGGLGWLLHPTLVIVGIVVAYFVIKKVRSRKEAEVEAKAKAKPKTSG